MILKMFQKNILKLSLNESLSIVLLCGFLFPKFSFLNYNISIPDLLACIFAVTLLFKIKHIKLKIFEIFKFEILILIFFLFLLFFNLLISNIDAYSFLYVFRILIYISASIYILSVIKKKRVLKILEIALYIISFYIFFYIVYILINIWNYPIDVILYGYTKIRLKLPFEYSGTTSVPFAYLLALIFAYFQSKSKTLKMSLFFVAQIFTISRAAILASSITLLFKYKKFGFVVFFITILLVVFKTILGGGFDHSSSDRIFFLIYSIELFLETFPDSLFGYGLSPTILYSNTGYFYYENIFSQSLMNGGIFLTLIVFMMYIVFTYRILFKRKYIYIPVLIGNLLGGFNLFSTISLPIYFILVYYYND